MSNEEIEFKRPELPFLIMHDSVIIDIISKPNTKGITKYRDSARFMANYFLLRQALLGMKSKKSTWSTSQVFEFIEKNLKENTDKLNTITALKDWIDEDSFTKKLKLNVKSSVMVLSHFRAKSSDGRVILIANDDEIGGKLINFYKQSGFIFADISSFPFAVWNTNELKDFMEKYDGSELFSYIEKLII